MSVENAKKFREDFKENEELKEKIKKELELYKDSGKKEKEQIPEIARKLGYDFTDEEFKEECLKPKEISDEELANVSGGVLWLGEDAPDGHELWCIITYYHHGWQSYYWQNNICENCQSKNGYRETYTSFYCRDCGHRTKLPGSGGGSATSGGSC